MAKRAVAVLRPRERTRDEWSAAIREAMARLRGGFGDFMGEVAAFGGLLVEAKSSKVIDYGEWEEFIEDDCALSARTAQKYMRASRKLAELSPEEASATALLGLDGALDALAGKDEVTRLAKGGAEPVWDASQTARRHQAELGQTVRLDMHNEHALWRWSIAEGRFVRCDRRGDFGNPYVMDEDGTRDEVCDWYEHHYWPFKRSLHGRLGELDGGKVLGCWCAQDERCHCDFLLRMVEEL